MAEEQTKQAAVYVGWTTFLNTLSALALGMPNVIDKSVFDGQSGGVQTQLMAALRFLGLIDDKGVPTPALGSIAVRDEASRKVALKKILERCYADLFALDLAKATMAQLNEKMQSSYSVTGDTREKAIRFFLQAAKYADVPIGRFLQVKTASTGTARKPRRPGRKNGDADDAGEDSDEETPPAANGTGKTISLRSGGTLSVSATVDMFALAPDDRKFLFDLIDRLNEYEAKAEEVF